MHKALDKCEAEVEGGEDTVQELREMLAGAEGDDKAAVEAIKAVGAVVLSDRGAVLWPRVCP